MTSKFLQSYAFSPRKKQIIIKFGLSSIDSCIICLVNLQNVKKILKNKNTLPGKILQCCRSVPYILLTTLSKPLAFDSKLNIK
jgi:hypothetical protein